MTQPDGEVDREGIRNQFRWSLQALAVSAEAQRSLFPDFVSKTDELVLDFDHWFWAARSILDEKFSDEQCEALQAIDRRLGAMSREGVEFDEELWWEESLGDRPEWEDVRAMAKLALARLGWTAEKPPSGRAFYSNGSQSSA